MTTAAADLPMTAVDLRHWLETSLPWLATEGVDGILSSGPRLVGEGACWISFASRWGVGRVVREPGGTSTRTVHRHSADRAVLDETSATTTEAHLLAVVAALGEHPREPLHR